MKTSDPVCSRVNKHGRGGLVLRWVTTGESPLLYVFASLTSLDTFAFLFTCLFDADTCVFGSPLDYSRISLGYMDMICSRANFFSLTLQLILVVKFVVDF
jgi:hypothetical protein